VAGQTIYTVSGELRSLIIVCKSTDTFDASWRGLSRSSVVRVLLILESARAIKISGYLCRLLLGLSQRGE
jgi:hypothetical protein